MFLSYSSFPLSLWSKFTHNERMKTVWLLVLLTYGCSQVSVKESKHSDDDEVSIYAALSQAHASYLRGCVEAFKTSKLSPSFPLCKERADAHLKEIEGMVGKSLIVPEAN